MNKETIILAIMGFIGFQLKNILNYIYGFTINRFSYSISVISQYRTTFERINEYIKTIDSKVIKNNITAYIDNSHGEDVVISSLNYGEYVFWYKASLFMISKSFEKGGSSDIFKETISIRIVFNHKKKSKELEEKLKEGTKNKDFVKIELSYYESIYRCCKPMDKLFCKEKETIIKHLKCFIKNKKVYENNSLSYKTGIILYGEPGTGKTSMAKAIADFMGYDIKVIGKEQLQRRDFSSLISEINRKKVVLIEEIDCLTDPREPSENMNTIRTDKTEERPTEKTHDSKGVLYNLLNLLDGYYSPEECIFVMTTNYIERVDKALMRPGRADLKIEMKRIEKNEAKEMCLSFGANPDTVLEGIVFPETSANVQMNILKHIQGE